MKEFNLDVPRMGYIIIVRKPDKADIFSRGIFETQKAMGFSDDAASFCHVVISGGGPDIVNIQPPKARLRNLLEAYGGRYVRILRLKNDPDYEAKARYKIAYFAATLCDRPYDVMGILKFKIGLLFHFKNLYFCSEGSTWAIRKERPGFMPGVAEYKCMPAHFAASDELEVAWEGILPKELTN